MGRIIACGVWHFDQRLRWLKTRPVKLVRLSDVDQQATNSTWRRLCPLVSAPSGRQAVDLLIWAERLLILLNLSLSARCATLPQAEDGCVGHDLTSSSAFFFFLSRSLVHGSSRLKRSSRYAYRKGLQHRPGGNREGSSVAGRLQSYAPLTSVMDAPPESGVTHSLWTSFCRRSMRPASARQIRIRLM
jgi:hypothetical protein